MLKPPQFRLTSLFAWAGLNPIRYAQGQVIRNPAYGYHQLYQIA